MRGKQTDDSDRLLHRASRRAFQRAFMLAEGIEVTGARLDNGCCRSTSCGRSRSRAFAGSRIEAGEPGGDASNAIDITARRVQPR